MPTPYANTALHLGKTDLPTIRESIKLATARRHNIAPYALTFEPQARLLRAGAHQLTLRGDTLTHTTGYFELEDEWTGPGGKRKAVWRVAQSPNSDHVEVQFTGTVSGHPGDERRANWGWVRDLFAEWQGRYSFRDPQDRAMPIVDKISSRADVERLAAHAMKLERRHALVLISPTFERRQYPVSHHQLNAWLAGYVTVVRVEDAYTRDLSEALGGREFGCFDGGLRILQRDYRDRKQRWVFNPLYMRNQLIDMQRQGTLEDHLFQAIQVKGQQARRFVKPQPTFERVRELLRHQYTILDRQEHGPDLNKLSLRIALNDAQTVNDQLRERIDALEEAAAARDSPERIGLAERLARRFAEHPHVRLWKTALDAATPVDADHHVARSVDRALDAIEAYAAALAERDDFHLGNDPYHFFKNRGVAYHYTDSPSTMGKYGEHRTFTQGDETRTVVSHFTLNTNTDRCVQLYFDTDPERRVLNLVYAGKHLPTAEGTYNN